MRSKGKNVRRENGEWGKGKMGKWGRKEGKNAMKYKWRRGGKNGSREKKGVKKRGGGGGADC